jgi:hypothetical protein
MENSYSINNSTINENDMSVMDLNASVFINAHDSPEELRNKCINLVKLPNEAKYGKFINQLLKDSNIKYINEHKDDKFFCEKLREVNEYVQLLKMSKKIKIKDFIKIKEFAISKGGFLTSENRKVLYKKIYLLNHSNTYKMLFIDYNSIINKCWDFHQTDIFSEKRIYDDLSSTCEDKTINVDYTRSRILQIAKNKTEKELTTLISLDLCKFLKLICSLNNNVYNYYQGYHDLALFFILLYHNCPHYAVSVFQRFSEFNLKELLNLKYNQKKIEEDGRYNMIEMNDTLKILKFIIDYMDPKVKIFFEEIEKEQEINYCRGNNKINDEKNKDYIICDFAFEWIITLFTRYFDDYNKIYRIFDYLMVSHSLAIYFLSAELIIDFYYKIKNKEYIKDKAGQFNYFVKNLKFEEIDFDYYIQNCEKNLQKYIGDSKFKEMYKNLKLNKFYPVISEQPFVEKWVMTNNQEEYRNNFWNYLMGQWGLFKSIFFNDDVYDYNSKNKKNNKK